jgi:L-asparagine transporter-like permease
VFPFLVKSNGTVAIFVYLLIALSELRLRGRLEREAPGRIVVRMWLYPWLTLVAIAGMVAILAAMAFIPDQRVPLGAGLASLAMAVGVFWLRRWRLRSRRAAPSSSGPPAADPISAELQPTGSVAVTTAPEPGLSMTRVPPS